MIKIPRVLTLLFCSFLVVSQAWSQGGQIQDKLSQLRCLVTTDFYIVHFTAFQPRAGETDPKKMFRPYCQDLPEASRAYLTVDLVDQDVRKMPVALKLVEEAQGAENGQLEPQQRMLVEVPAKVYKYGVVETQADFDKPGHYALLVTIGEAMAEENTIRIPLRVGLGTVPEEGSGDNTPELLIIALGGVALFSFFGWRFLKRRKQQGA